MEVEIFHYLVKTYLQLLVKCQQFVEKISILSLSICDDNIPEVGLNSYIRNAVDGNLTMLCYNNSYFEVYSLEAFYIKVFKRKIDASRKAFKELQLFK